MPRIMNIIINGHTKIRPTKSKLVIGTPRATSPTMRIAAAIA